MGNTYKPENACRFLLNCCLRGERWSPELLDQALAINEGRAFLSEVVERLGDLFEPELCSIYARLFSQVIERTLPGYSAAEIEARYRRIRVPHSPPAAAERVYVLSRVTLGADVAVTSVLLDAAKQRYPDAEIFFVAPAKNYELFAADPRIHHFPAPYARTGSLRDRLQSSIALSGAGPRPALFLDPDSRLSQLGLLPACDESDYFFFESRAYGGKGTDRLPDLAARWAREVFRVENARPYIATQPSPDPPVDITVSLGVGENPAKRIGGDFEAQLLRMLADTGASVLVDKGGDPEERQRVERILPPGVQCHDGAFAPFASLISRSKLFVGYDSAGGHVASACGVPVISIFCGEVSERMFQRWRPQGTIIRGELGALELIQHALKKGD